MASNTQNNTPTPHTIYAADWGTWTRRVVTVMLIVGTILALSLLGPILQLTVLALIIAFALFYPVRTLTLRMRVPYALSVLIVFLIYITTIIVLFITFSQSLADFVTQVTGDLQIRINYFVSLLRDWESGTQTIIIANPFTGQPLEDIDFILQPASDFVNGQDRESLANISSLLPNVFGNIGSTLGTVGTTVGTVTGLLGNFVLVNFLALLFLLEIPGLFSWASKRTADIYRRELAILVGRIGRVWTGFFRGQIIVCIGVGALTAVQLTLMGVPNALLVGAVTAIVSLIPMLGGIISIVPIALVPLIGGSTVFPDLSNGALALLVVGINFIVQQVIWNVVAPKVTGDAVNLPVPVIILGLFIGVSVMGVLGALLAAPVMGIVRVIVDYLGKKVRGGDPYPNVPEPEFLRSGLFRELVDAAVAADAAAEVKAEAQAAEKVEQEVSAQASIAVAALFDASDEAEVRNAPQQNAPAT